jgi:hypothetical protein
MALLRSASYGRAGPTSLLRNYAGQAERVPTSPRLSAVAKAMADTRGACAGMTEKIRE